MSWHVYNDVVESNPGPLGEKQESNPLETKTLITVFLRLKKFMKFQFSSFGLLSPLNDYSVVNFGPVPDFLILFLKWAFLDLFFV